MLNDQVAAASVIINASVERVWNGLTNPELIKQYLFGTETVTNWNTGSSIVFQGEYEGKMYKDHGTIISNEPYKQLKYSYWSSFTGLADAPENYSTVTYTLEKISDSQTKFTWSQRGFADEKSFNDTDGRMTVFVGTIKDTIEKSAL